MNIEKNKSLKSFNTFGIDVHAAFFSRLQHLDDLAALFEFNSQYNKDETSNILMLGGGSNVLFTKNINGLVIKNELTGIEKVQEDEAYVYVKAGAGESWHLFVLYCLQNNYAGVENLALIPGSVGASPMQNIGAYGVEIKDAFHSLEAFNLKEKKIFSLSKSDCEFGYRESVFKNKYKDQFLVTSVTYKLHKKPVFNISYGAIKQEMEKMGVHELSIQAIAQAVIRIRTSKLPDPKVIGNAGSFFKNPEVDINVFENLKRRFPNVVGYPLHNGNMKLATGWLIEQCGWKGYRKEDAGCHAKQALVLVNYGHATGAEIYDLSTAIVESVQKNFGIALEREVNII